VKVQCYGCEAYPHQEALWLAGKPNQIKRVLSYYGASQHEGATEPVTLVPRYSLSDGVYHCV